MDSENPGINFQASVPEAQKKRRRRKRGRQMQKSEEIENGSSDSNNLDVPDHASFEENVVFNINKWSLDDIDDKNDNTLYTVKTVDAVDIQNSIESNIQRQISTSNNKDLLADNNVNIFTDGIPCSRLKKKANLSNATEITELNSSDVDKLYPSTSVATEPEVVQLYNSKALPKGASTYQLEKFVGNVLIIINQKTFADKSIRKGTEKDVAALTKTFEAFDFTVVPYTDRTVAQIEQILKAVSEQNFTDYGCVAIAVLTHGNEGGELMAKDGTYSEVDIINCLKTHANHSLVTKPRLLIIQACRGPNAVAGVPVHEKGKIRTDLNYKTKPYSLPVEADMLVLHSTYPGNPAHRDEVYGTWLVQALCSKIDEMAATHDLLSILTRVQHNVAADMEHPVYNRAADMIDVNKQMPVVTSTLIRKFYLRKYEGFENNETIVDNIYTNVSVDTGNVGSNPDTCLCALNYFDYIKECLRHYVEDNTDDTTARSLFALTETLDDEKFNSAKGKCAVAIADHLEQKAKHSVYYKFLHIYKRY